MLIGKEIIGTVGYMGGIPSVPEPFCFSWGQMVQYNAEVLCGPNQIVHYTRATEGMHFSARNYLVDNCYGEWLLQLDTDHVFDPDILVRMLNVMYKYNLEVLSGLYCLKMHPFPPNLYADNPEYKEGLSHESLRFSVIADFDRSAELFQIASTGGGILLVRKRVFDRIKKELGEKPFSILPPHGEDHSFFKRLQKLNIKAWCAPNIESNHLMWKKLTLDDYDTTDLQYIIKSEVDSIAIKKE